MADAPPETRTLTAPGMMAAFVPDLGMIGCALVHGGEELLGLRDGLDAYREQGRTMGIPLLHPWANRLMGPVAVSPLLRTDANGIPIHGVLPAALPFAVESETASSLEAVFSTNDHGDILEVFPYPHRLRVQASLTDDALEIRTTLLALGRRPVPVAFGYHPYLRVPGSPRAEWELDLPVRTKLVLDERMLPTGDRVRAHIPPGRLGGRGLDDEFADITDGATFAVRGGGREIAVTFVDGYRVAHVYAPPDGDFVCFEPMTTPTNALASGDSLPHVRPGDTYSAAFRISVTA
jgi:galactose mutarotase-like enzyme